VKLVVAYLMLKYWIYFDLWWVYWTWLWRFRSLGEWHYFVKSKELKVVGSQNEVQIRWVNFVEVLFLIVYENQES